MQYTLNSGRVITIGDNDIRNLMDACGCSKEEAIDIWLTDHNFIVNQEQEKLDKSAKNAGIADVRDKKRTKTSQKPREIKVSAQKKQLFESVLRNLSKIHGISEENIQVLTKYRQIAVKIGGKSFKITISEDRKPTK